MLSFKWMRFTFGLIFVRIRTRKFGRRELAGGGLETHKSVAWSPTANLNQRKIMPKRLLFDSVPDPGKTVLDLATEQVDQGFRRLVYEDPEILAKMTEEEVNEDLREMGVNPKI